MFILHINNPINKHKICLLNLAEELSNASKAFYIMGVSRETFYRYHELANNSGVEEIVNQSK
ncbi:helix-turn-helix domain-containing protein [Entomomonas moraniae]